MSINTDAAFPYAPTWISNEEYWALQPGMSLRDYFAAKALNGMLASDATVDRTTVDKKAWAHMAYGFADAMLEARWR